MTWEEVTAISTLVLAAVTARLAHSTRRLAREAGSETRANWQPVLVIDAPKEDDGTSGSFALEDRRLSVEVANVGRGPALMVTATLRPDDGDDRGTAGILRGRAARDVVAPGEHLILRWRDFDPPLPDRSLGIHVWSGMGGMITYGDVAYVRYETEFELGFRVDGAVALLDQRFLGATRDRMGRIARARYRAFVWTLAIEARMPRRFRRLARRLARTTSKPHG